MPDRPPILRPDSAVKAIDLTPERDPWVGLLDTKVDEYLANSDDWYIYAGVDFGADGEPALTWTGGVQLDAEGPLGWAKASGLAVPRTALDEWHRENGRDPDDLEGRIEGRWDLDDSPLRAGGNDPYEMDLLDLRFRVRLEFGQHPNCHSVLTTGVLS